MHVDLLMYIRSMKMVLYASTKGIDSGQPAHFAQADLSRYILLSVNFLYINKSQGLSGKVFDS